VLTPVLFAFLIAYALDPVVDAMEHRGLRRDVAIGILLTVLLSATVGFLLVAVPAIYHDLRAFFVKLPIVIEQAIERFGPMLEARGISVRDSGHELCAQLRDHLGIAKDALEPVATAVSWLVGGTVSFLGALA